MRSIVGVKARLLDTIVAPATDSLIGGQFVGIPHLAYITRCTTIDTINVAVAIGTTVTSHGNRSVALVEQAFNAYLGCHVGVERLYIEITDARRHAEAHCKCCNRNQILKYSFHDLYCFVMIIRDNA